MTQSPSLLSEKTGQAANVIFLPPRFYKSRAEWTEEDWKEERRAHVRHRRNTESSKTWHKGRHDRTPKRDHVVVQNKGDTDFREMAWAWAVFLGLCILAAVLLVLFGHAEPVSHPTAPYDVPYIGQSVPRVMNSPIQ